MANEPLKKDKSKDYIERIKETLKEKEQKRVENLAKKGIGVSSHTILTYSPPDPFQVPNPEKDKAYLFGNANANARMMSSAQGWRPTKRGGKEVRIGDTILLEMPKRQEKETILKPREDKRARKKRVIKNTFENAVSKIRGATPEGNIDYD